MIGEFFFAENTMKAGSTAEIRAACCSSFARLIRRRSTLHCALLVGLLGAVGVFIRLRDIVSTNHPTSCNKKTKSDV